MKKIKKFLLLLILIMIHFSLSLLGDGFIIIPHHPHPHPYPHPPMPRPRPDFRPFPLEVKYHRVEVKIEDRVARTYIDQVFYNPTRRRLEGYYLFPLPKKAVIKKFSMYINGKETQAELLDAKKARKIYEDIVRKQLDPALLEYSGTGLFRARIFPIEPHSEKRVKISYNQILNTDNHTTEYLYPLNTEKFSSKPLGDVSIHVEVKSKEKIKSIYCPTHKTEIISKGEYKAVVGYEDKQVKPDKDFKLYINTDNSELGFSLHTYKKKNENGFFFLTLSPGFKKSKRAIVKKDIAFVLDVSGSMVGDKLRQAKKALLFCVENLNLGDRFEVIRFSTEAEALFDGLQPVTEGNLAEAREFIKDLRAIGGTNIDEALDTALKLKKRKGVPYMIIFITDGKPTIGEINEDILVKKIKQGNESNSRIFTFGIGNEINTHLLDKITELTRASRTYITPDEDIEIKISNFYSRIQSPILTDVILHYGQGIRATKIYPRNLPDLFKGSSVIVMGRYKGSGNKTIKLEGRYGNKKKELQFKGKFSPEDEIDDFIPPLWAARRIGYLLDQIRLHGTNKELVEEVTELARSYGVITPYTSYLILEDERENVRRRVLHSKDQTLGGIVGRDTAFEARNQEEFSNMKVKTGAPSVRASKEVQQLNEASVYAQTQPGKARLNFRDKKGGKKNLTQQVKNIQGRAIYNTGDVWVDSLIQSQSQKNTKAKRIQFASTKYFELLKKEPESAEFLALGKNIRFVINNILYEIYE
jgi:Ca-activated chloride channel family protein